MHGKKTSVCTNKTQIFIYVTPVSIGGEKHAYQGDVRTNNLPKNKVNYIKHRKSCSQSKLLTVARSSNKPLSFTLWKELLSKLNFLQKEFLNGLRVLQVRELQSQYRKCHEYEISPHLTRTFVEKTTIWRLVYLCQSRLGTWNILLPSTCVEIWGDKMRLWVYIAVHTLSQVK